MSLRRSWRGPWERGAAGGAAAAAAGGPAGEAPGSAGRLGWPGPLQRPQPAELRVNARCLQRWSPLFLPARCTRRPICVPRFLPAGQASAWHASRAVHAPPAIVQLAPRTCAGAAGAGAAGARPAPVTRWRMRRRTHTRGAMPTAPAGGAADGAGGLAGAVQACAVQAGVLLPWWLHLLCRAGLHCTMAPCQ